MSTLAVDNITNEAGTGSPSLPNGLTVGGVNYPTTGPLSNRNKIINGAMVIDQRNAGAVFTSTGLFYSLDRWLLQAVGATNTAQQVTGSTGNNKAVLITGNSGNTFTAYSQKIESLNIQDVAGQPATVSFTLSGSASGSVSVRQLYPTATDNYTATSEPVSGTTVNFTTTPTRYTVTFTADANANKGLWLVFDFGAVGAGVTRTLEEVQLEAGTVATPFEHRSFGQELALCQRYYYRSAASLATAWGALYNNDAGRVWMSFPTTMRAAPSVTFDGLTFDNVGIGATTATSVGNVVVAATGVTFDGILVSPAGGQFRPFAYVGTVLASAEL
jgi:hypothetical protein